MRLRTSSDVGGTFTDLCVFDEKTQNWNAFKSPTTPDDMTIGVLETLRLASEYYDLPFKDFLAHCASLTDAGRQAHV